MRPPFRSLALALALASFTAAGQGARDSAPDESWAAFPGETAPQAPPGSPRLSPPPLAPAWPDQLRVPVAPRPAWPEQGRAAVSPRAPEVARPAPAAPRPVAFNNVSIYGAPALGTLQRGLGLLVGFPLVGVRAGLGVSDAVDLGIAFESYYGMMNELRATTRIQFVRDPNWTAAALLEAGTALFTERASLEDHGPRWLTGRRNYNVMPGLVLSYRGDSPRSARMFLDVRYLLALDTEPYHRDPLGGVPPAFEVGHNFPVRFGAEMPFSPRTSFVFILGFDLHGRTDDSAFMPSCSVGLVSAI